MAHSVAFIHRGYYTHFPWSSSESFRICLGHKASFGCRLRAQLRTILAALILPWYLDWIKC